MTIKDAIKTARDNVSMFAFGPQYKVSVYDPSVRAWREGCPKGYWQARQDAGCAKIRLATLALGKDDREAYAQEYEYRDNGGRWTDYV